MPKKKRYVYPYDPARRHRYYINSRKRDQLANEYYDASLEAGHFLTEDEVDAHPSLQSAGTYRRYFGQKNTLYYAAQRIEPDIDKAYFKKRRSDGFVYTREYLSDKLKELKKVLKKIPTQKDVRNAHHYGICNMPSPRTYTREYGSWKAVRFEIFGISSANLGPPKGCHKKPNRRSWSREEVATTLYEWETMHGQAVTCRILKETESLPSAMTVYRNFTSLRQAVSCGRQLLFGSERDLGASSYYA